MSQNDYVIANATAPAFRADLNLALQALASSSSGSTAPSTIYANMLWYDTATNILKMRSEANDAWIDLGTLDQSGNTFTPEGLSNKADIASPALTGNPTAPTQTVGNNSTRLATTAFVNTAISDSSWTQSSNINTTSGTSVTLSSFPSSANELEVRIWGMSMSSFGDIKLQLGASGTADTSGYVGVMEDDGNSGVSLTTGLFQMDATNTSSVFSGVIRVVRKPATNTWVCQGSMNHTPSYAVFHGGAGKTVSGTVNTFRFVVSAGSFDAGTLIWRYR